LLSKDIKQVVDNFHKNKKHIPFYDTDNVLIRKQIGEVIDLQLDKDGNLEHTVKLYDGKFLKGITKP